MIQKKEFNTLEELNEFNDENDIRIISIHEETQTTTSQLPSGGFISTNETCLKIWYEDGLKKSLYGT